MHLRIVVILAMLSSQALAQSASPPQSASPDPAFLQKAIGALRQQRDAAADVAASQQARAEMLAEEIAKLKAELEALKKPKEGAGQ